MEDLTDVRCVHLAHMKDTLPFAHCRCKRSATSLVDGHMVYLNLNRAIHKLYLI